MLLDKETLLSDAQSIVGTNTTLVSTNAYDTGAAQTLPSAGGGTIPRDVGKAGLKLHAQVVTPASGGTSVQLQLIQSAAANLGSPTVIAETAAIPVASLVAGYQFRLSEIPPGITQRYLGLQYVLVGAVAAGAVTAGIVFDKQTNPFVG